METWEQVWKLTIETLAVLAWPAVVTVALIVFRKPVSTLIHRMREGEIMGAKFRADEAVAVALAAADEFNEEAAAAGSETPAYGREQVETLVRAAAVAGYDIGNIRAFATDMEPVIAWGGDAPQIVYWRSTKVGEPPTVAEEVYDSRTREALQAEELRRSRIDFASLLRWHRISAGLSMEELAQRTGISGIRIRQLERGTTSSPRAETVQSLADALELDDAQLREFNEAAARRPSDRGQARTAMISSP
ncbi:helix-turn-helix domain-containing protein [Jiangella mangrovi]|uniref:DNA-binding XRE family transcriptional regulator n=1 Tax=Jiangella mangrovi TaxID=1524084 RepID=A0A7W9GPP1_9ACTN|nr:helix-turn-helix transcriptional regulator [Jiangella mangrovi]MBB5787743.1 DNA-binding XRE family transcriptional regulator [Jiangella mangrovi]